MFSIKKFLKNSDGEITMVLRRHIKVPMVKFLSLDSL
jgi:hypothetical protein